jgi:ATP-dependent RNA helicase RhlE
MSFDALGLAEPILRAVAAAGYSTPTPIQERAIPHVCAGRDLLGCAQTGTGKTAAFALPILHRLLESGPPSRSRHRRPRILVLSPTRELTGQIADSFKTYAGKSGLRTVSIVGGVNQNPQVRALSQGVDIIVATPGRLLDLFQQRFVDLSGIEVLVLDEADRMLDMGFLPDVRRIVAKVPEERQTLFFSATMPPDIQDLADAILRDPVRIRIRPVQATTDLIAQSVYHVSTANKVQLLAHLLESQPIERALVFTRTKRGADRVVRQLEKTRIRAEAIHGNKSQAARQRTLENFKAGRISILVATDLASRGIDVEGVSHVLNYDLPEQPETYVHRIGRTGRAGASGIAISFCDASERGSLRDIERLGKQKILVAEDHPKYVAPAKSESPQQRSSGSTSSPSESRPATPSSAKRHQRQTSRSPGKSSGAPTQSQRKSKASRYKPRKASSTDRVPTGYALYTGVASPGNGSVQAPAPQGNGTAAPARRKRRRRPLTAAR